MSHDNTVKGGNTCQPPDAAANTDYNSSGMSPSGNMREDYPTLKRDHDQMAAVDVRAPAASAARLGPAPSHTTLSRHSSMERSASRASSTSSRGRTSPPTISAPHSHHYISESNISAHSSPLSPQHTGDPERRRTGFRAGKDLLKPGGSPVKRVYHGKSATSPVDLAARATEIASRKRKKRDNEPAEEGTSSKRKAVRIVEDEEGASDTEHSDQLEQTESNNADPATVAKVLNALERKRAKNRDSARKSRLAKKETVDRLQQEIDTLKNRLRLCEAERDYWKAKGGGGESDDGSEHDTPPVDKVIDST